MNFPEKNYIKSIVQIRDADGSIKGTGFAINDGCLIVTCMHVIDSCKSVPTIALYHDKWTNGISDSFEVICTEISKSMDIAFLRLPEKLRISPLALKRSWDIIGREIETLGFPDTGTKWLTGQASVLAPTEIGNRELIQVNSKEITAGFSGAPAWDPLGVGVVGIIDAVLLPDMQKRLGEVAFMIPSEAIAAALPGEIVLVEETKPYVGLTPFEANNKRFFFGREPEIKNTITAIRNAKRWIVMSAPSGSGKSSVLRAGAYSQLEESLNSECKLLSALMRPGNDPYAAIKQATGSDTIASFVTSAHDSGKQALLIIDQAEEFFTLSPASSRDHFLSEMHTELQHPNGLRVLFAIRNDFEKQLFEKLKLHESLDTGTRILLELYLSKQTLKRIIEEPAQCVGRPWPTAFIDFMVIAAGAYQQNLKEMIGGEATVLPLLQFTLSEVWKRWSITMSPTEAYEQIGGIGGSIGGQASAYFQNAAQPKRIVIRRILLDLVQLIKPDGKSVLLAKRRRFVSEIPQFSDKDNLINESLREMIDAHLLTSSFVDGRASIEIVHESLFRGWNDLGSWITENEKDIFLRQEIESRRHDWENSGKKFHLMLGDELLHRINNWQHKEQWLSLIDTEYVKLSQRQASIKRCLIGIAGLFALAVYFMPTWISYDSPWSTVHALPGTRWVNDIRDSITTNLNKEVIYSTKNAVRDLTASLIDEGRDSLRTRACDNISWRYVMQKTGRCEYSMWDLGQALSALSSSPYLDTKQDLHYVVIANFQKAVNETPFVPSENNCVKAECEIGWPTSRYNQLAVYPDAIAQLWPYFALSEIIANHTNSLNLYEKKWIKQESIVVEKNAEKFRILNNESIAFGSIVKELDSKGNIAQAQYQYSPYSTTIALLSALETNKARIGKFGSTKNINNLVHNFEFTNPPIHDFTRQLDYWMTPGDISGQPEALSFQIASELLLSETITKNSLSKTTIKTIQGLLDRAYEYQISPQTFGDAGENFDGHSVMRRVSQAGDEQAEPINYSWYPWATATAALWYNRTMCMHLPLQENRARRYVNRFLALAKSATDRATNKFPQNKKDLTYQRAELLLSLSIALHYVDAQDNTASRECTVMAAQ